MGRPEPYIITSSAYDENLWEVLEVSGMWALTYQQQLVSIRRSRESLISTGFKYPKTVFPTEAIARNTANKLNEIFDTVYFSYKEIR